jgi:signal transduction histidine kinase
VETVGLSTLARHALAPFGARFDRKSISLTTDWGNDPAVRVDPDQFVGVLNNLLENALNYTPHGGAVTVRIVPEGSAAALTIANTGDGIPPHDLPFVFERFYRGEKSRSREHGGAGIGLSLVKQIVEAHRGTVSVDSREGLSTFRVTLPRADS